jgi:transposase
MALKRENRQFSTVFKKEKVKLIEEGKVTALQIVRTYNVSSAAVYKWIHKFGSYEKTERVVVEKTSEANKTLELIQKVAALEKIIGQQQVKLIYQENLIVASNDFIKEESSKKSQISCYGKLHFTNKRNIYKGTNL